MAVSNSPEVTNDFTEGSPETNEACFSCCRVNWSLQCHSRPQNRGWGMERQTRGDIQLPGKVVLLTIQACQPNPWPEDDRRHKTMPTWENIPVRNAVTIKAPNRTRELMIGFWSHMVQWFEKQKHFKQELWVWQTGETPYPEGKWAPMGCLTWKGHTWPLSTNRRLIHSGNNRQSAETVERSS